MSKLYFKEGTSETITNSFRYSKSFGLFIAEKDADGNFYPVFVNQSCRSYSGEIVFYHKAAGKFLPKQSHFNSLPAYHTVHDWSPLSGDTHIGFEVDEAKLHHFILNFKIINEYETKYDLPLSRYTLIEDYPPNSYKTSRTFVVVSGSGHWKDSCWKIQLYTYLLKTLFFNQNYKPESYFYKLFKQNEAQFMNNIKMPPELELFDTSVYNENNIYARHNNTGFVAISEGANQPMAKLLGIDVKDLPEEEEDDEDEGDD